MTAQAQETFDRAKRLVQQQKYAQALDLLETHSDVFPNDNGHVVYFRARCLANLGRVEEALSLCEQLTADFRDPRGKKLASKLGRRRNSDHSLHAKHPVDILPFEKPQSHQQRQMSLDDLVPTEDVDVSKTLARPDGRWPGLVRYGLPLLTILVFLLCGIAVLRDRANLLPQSPPQASTVDTTESAAIPEAAIIKDEKASEEAVIDSPESEEETIPDEAGENESQMASVMPPGEEKVAKPQATDAPQSAPQSAQEATPPADKTPITEGSDPQKTVPAKSVVPADLHGWTAVEDPKFPEGPVPSVVEMQPFRLTQTLRNDRGDWVELTNLNPYVGAWFLLKTSVAGVSSVRHLELLSKEGEPNRKPSLHLYRDGLVVAVKDWGSRYFSLWTETEAASVFVPTGQEPAPENRDVFTTDKLNPAPVLRDVFAPDHVFNSPYASICEGFVLIRSQKNGSATRLEAATDLLRETQIGDWFVEAAKPYLIPSPEVGEDLKAEGAPAAQTHEVATPLDAQVEQSLSNLYCNPAKIGIETNVADNRFFYGRWYHAANHPNVFVSIMKPNVVSKEILASYTDRVSPIGSHDRKRSEANAMVYLVAYDLSHFRFGYAMGADHPKVDWSPRVPKSARKGNGPDGYGTKNPLVTIGAVPPYHSGIVEGSFTGGFKREHAAFKVGPLAETNNGNHFGFMEQGVVFSTLQPGLASLVVTHDGSLHMMSWPEDTQRFLTKVTHVRQNCVPIIEGRDDKGLSIPGLYVNKWGPGCWSGDQDGDFLTLRGGAAIQDTPTGRFLIYAYFTGATPSTMARIFQAFQCRYGMLLDMNTPTYCYAALYNRDAEGKLIKTEYLNNDMGADKNAGAVKFVETNDTRDFFYIMRKESPPPSKAS